MVDDTGWNNFRGLLALIQGAKSAKRVLIDKGSQAIGERDKPTLPQRRRHAIHCLVATYRNGGWCYRRGRASVG
jgi:hypothetical protein